MNKIMVLLISFTLLGCTSTGTIRSLSSGRIGCPPEEIEVQNENSSYLTGVSSWAVICRGKKFYCSSITHADGSTPVNCTPEVK